MLRIEAVERRKAESVILTAVERLTKATFAWQFGEEGTLGNLAGEDYLWVVVRKEKGLVFYGRNNHANDGKLTCVTFSADGRYLNLRRWKELPDNGREYDTPLVQVDIDKRSITFYRDKDAQHQDIDVFDIRNIVTDILFAAPSLPAGSNLAA